MTRKFHKHEERVNTPILPPDIAPFLYEYKFFRLVRNYPTVAHVFRAVKAGNPTLFLKVGMDLGPEFERLSWLEGRLTVPTIVAYSARDKHEYLLLTQIPGLPADDKKWVSNTAGLVETLVEEVNTIHSLPRADCPFDASLDTLMADAEGIFRHQLLDPRRLSEAYRHRTISDLFGNLLRLRPANEHIVFTHGDLCLPNVLIRQEASAGFVDWGLAGLSDPHRDLALLARSIHSNLGEKWLRLFFDLYGHEVDKRRIEFYTLLDQFTKARCRQSTNDTDENREA